MQKMIVLITVVLAAVLVLLLLLYTQYILFSDCLHIGYDLCDVQAEYHVIEGIDAVAVILINRDLTVYPGELAIHYATSDLTAQGVDLTKFSACQSLAPSDRGAALCGDYAQSSGILVINAGISSGAFQVPILNDLCKERFMKYLQVRTG